MAEPVPTPAPFPQAALVLSPDGIAQKGAGPVGFGTARSEVDALAGKLLGARPRLSDHEDCGAGPIQVSSYGPLDLSFQDGRFVGWFLHQPRDGKGPRIVTVDGIAPGASMTALAAERPVRPIVDSTLEGEFQYITGTGGTITGFYQGDVRNGTIASLASGINCFFR